MSLCVIDGRERTKKKDFLGHGVLGSEALPRCTGLCVGVLLGSLGRDGTAGCGCSWFMLV